MAKATTPAARATTLAPATRLPAPLPAVKVAGLLVVATVDAEATPAGVVELPAGKGATGATAEVITATDVTAELVAGAAMVEGAAEVDGAAEVEGAAVEAIAMELVADAEEPGAALTLGRLAHRRTLMITG